jgi:DNA-binding GntR family transcriptional regulator
MTMQQLIPNLQTREAAAYQLIREMILELELAPGTRVVESDIAARFRVSKTPIREALLVLDSEQLVVRTPYQGATVTWLTVDEYEELLFLQDALEQAALPLVAKRLQPQQIGELDQLVADLAEKRSLSDSKGYSVLAFQIHRTLFSALGSTRFLRQIDAIVTPGRRYQKVLTHQFADAWDAEVAVIERRYQFVRDGKVDAAAKAVAEAHRLMRKLARSRLGDPLVAPFFRTREAAQESR